MHQLCRGLELPQIQPSPRNVIGQTLSRGVYGVSISPRDVNTAKLATERDVHVEFARERAFIQELRRAVATSGESLQMQDAQVEESWPLSHRWGSAQKRPAPNFYDNAKSHLQMALGRRLPRQIFQLDMRANSSKTL